jgi:hypothetical protein
MGIIAWAHTLRHLPKLAWQDAPHHLSRQARCHTFMSVHFVWPCGPFGCAVRGGMCHNWVDLYDCIICFEFVTCWLVAICCMVCARRLKIAWCVRVCACSCMSAHVRAYERVGNGTAFSINELAITNLYTPCAHVHFGFSLLFHGTRQSALVGRCQSCGVVVSLYGATVVPHSRIHAYTHTHTLVRIT